MLAAATFCGVSMSGRNNMTYKLMIKTPDGEMRTIFMDRGGKEDRDGAKKELMRQQALTKKDGRPYFHAGEITSVEVVTNAPPPPKVTLSDGTEVDPRNVARR